MSTGEALFWDCVSRKNEKGGFLLPELAVYKRDEVAGIIREWCPPLGGLRVLKTDLFEEASGEGPLLFGQFGEDEVHGVDISPDIVSKATANAASFAGKYNFIHGDVRNLPYPDGFFDLVVSNSTLDHLPRGDMPAALSELRRVLRPGGFLLLTIDNKENLPARVVAAAGIALGIIPFPIEFYSRKELAGMFSAAGLRVESADALIHLPSAVNRLLRVVGVLLPAAAVSGLARLAVRFARIIGAWPTRFRTGWFLAFLLSPVGHGGGR